MKTKIGNWNISNKEAFADYIKQGLIREYDCSPSLREQHDDAIKTKPTEKQRLELVAVYMSKSREELNNE